jgi:hypothetical protein
VIARASQSAEEEVWGLTAMEARVQELLRKEDKDEQEKGKGVVEDGEEEKGKVDMEDGWVEDGGEEK